MDGVLIDSEQFYEKRRYKYLKIKVINKQEGLNFIGSNEIAIWESLVPSH
jgi:beta-phosphoglucomutase-like phosphatase (HAD superfamily)